ncbi:MAG: PqqD family protein [Lachnospiraceae bacterium]|nr:PqqD family protein [Lachnospiraceae bacterium]
MEERRYTLRYAAGAYWLFCVPHPGEAYRAPLQLNRTGADIIRMAGQGLEAGEIVTRLCEIHEAEDEESCRMIRGDVAGFLKLLEDHDMRIIGEKGVSIL